MGSGRDDASNPLKDIEKGAKAIMAQKDGSNFEIYSYPRYMEMLKQEEIQAPWIVNGIQYRTELKRTIEKGGVNDCYWNYMIVPEHEILYITWENFDRDFIRYDNKGNTPPAQGVEAVKIECKFDRKQYRFARFHPADMVANHMVALEVIVQDIGHDGPFSNMSISYRDDSQASDHQDPIEQNIFLVDQRKDSLGPDDVETLIHDGLKQTKESTMAPDEQKTDLTAEEDNAKRLADSWPEIRQAVIYFYLNASGQMDLERAKRVIAKARGD